MIVFSSIGYTTNEVPVGAKTEINVQLATAFGSMNEIVIIGYQAVRKKTCWRPIRR